MSSTDKTSRETTPTTVPEEEERVASSSTSKEEKSPKEASTTPQKEAPESEDKPSTTTEEKAPGHSWQAIFSPQHNAYYFYNSETQETTWVNPLEPASSAASSSQATPPTSTSTEPTAEQPSTEDTPEATTSSTNPAISHYAALQAAALAQGIDPALAHLDPSLLSSVPGQAADKSGLPVFSAKFNRHTGAFARPDARDPSHLSEHERAKRMSSFYFDVDKWEQDLAKHGGSIRASSSTMYGAAPGKDDAGEWEEDGQGGKKRKRPSKKELELYKEKKKAKKLAKTAWLRQ